MAERNDGGKIRHDESGELPAVDSPPLSPAGASMEEPAEAEADAEVSGAAETTVASGDEAVIAEAATPRARFQLSRRNQRRVIMAAWVALIAGFGALFGGAVSNGLTGHRDTDIAGLEQRKAMRQSIDNLAKQVGDLKVKLAAATAANNNRVAKTAARADSGSSSDITGSIPAVPAVQVPIPRPAPRIAAAASRPAIVRNWSIMRSRGGLFVEGQEGIYEVVPGAVLPGLGPVRSIERRNGRWVVVTPKGLIVSSRDRGYFEDF